MSPIAQTSIDAYMAAVTQGRATTQRARIRACLRACGPLTRYEIHLITGIRYGSVCGRVNALIESGLARDDLETRPNPDGGSLANVVQLITPEPVQRRFEL